MSVEVHCPHCDAVGRVNSRFRGRRVHCPKCNEWVDVPMADGADASTTEDDDEMEVIVDTESLEDAQPIAVTPMSDDAFDDMFADSYTDSSSVSYDEAETDDALVASAALAGMVSGDARSEKANVPASASSSLVTGATLHPTHEVTEGHSLGLEFDEEGDELPKRKKREDGELDMTPMVDVTFLLLIFFMVTASFALQKSIQMPRQQSDAPSSSPIEEETEELDSVEVQIDERGSFLVLGPDWERETPGKQNLISALKDAMGGAGMEGMRLVIKVQEAAKLQALVDCMDAGTIAGYTELQVTQVEEFD